MGQRKKPCCGFRSGSARIRNKKSVPGSDPTLTFYSKSSLNVSLSLNNGLPNLEKECFSF